MTTYIHTLEISDGETIALDAALQNMIEKCDAEMKDGAKAPFLAWKSYCESMLKKLHEAPRVQMSGYVPPQRS
jgi:hypothetical protein